MQNSPLSIPTPTLSPGQSETVAELAAKVLRICKEQAAADRSPDPSEAISQYPDQIEDLLRQEIESISLSGGFEKLEMVCLEP